MTNDMASQVTITTQRELGQKLKQLREKHDLKQEGLGKKAHCAGVTVSRFESGERLMSLNYAMEFDNIFGTGQMFFNSVSVIRRKEKSFKQTASEAARNGSPSPIMGNKVPIPVLSAVPGVKNRWRNDDVERTIDFPDTEIQGRSMYCLKAKSDSMDRAGIRKDDVVLIDPTTHPKNDEIVLFGEGTDYQFLRYFKNEGQVSLVPESTQGGTLPLTLTKKNERKIRGVVEGVWFKRLRSK